MKQLLKKKEDSSPKKYTREERIHNCGVDCQDSVTWNHWSVGGEYERKLVLKNTHEKLQVIQYKLPKMKATFFVDFPDPVSVSSGMAHEIIIRFRPTQLVAIHDEIEIEVKDRGSFCISLHALTPYAEVSVPSMHDFQFCAVNSTTSAVLEIKNSGTVPVEFYWECPEPFSITPRRGALTEGEKSTITVTFTPLSATALVGQAVCKMQPSGELLSFMKLSGVGKFAFVRCLDGGNALDFGSLLTGTSKSRSVTMENRSCVDATFEIRRTDSDMVNPFVITPLKGVVPRDGQLRINVKYSPVSTDAHYTNDFKLTTVGGNKLDLRCSGSAQGPSITLSSGTLDFGDVDLDVPGKSVDKYVVLKNQADCSVNFQMMGCDPGCAFEISPSSGSVGAKGSVNLRIRFLPSAPLNYLRRIYVVGSQTSKSLPMDLFGTAYNQKSRPSPFTENHVKFFHARLEHGLGCITPEETERIFNEMNSSSAMVDGSDAQLRIDLQAAIASATAPKQKKESLSRIFPVESISAPFSLDQKRIVFKHGMSDAQWITVSNHTSSKATAFWSVPAGGPWIVSPESADVAAFSTTQFKVKLAVNAPSTSFGNYLECYVNYKTMRSFRLVNEETFTPAHCLPLQCQRMALPNENGAIPQVKTANSIAFPTCHEGDCRCQVFVIANEGDTVVTFETAMETKLLTEERQQEHLVFEESEAQNVERDIENQSRLLASTFEVYPSSGTILPNSTALLVCKFSPFKRAKFGASMRIIYNGSSVGTGNVFLRGEGFLPQLSLAQNGLLAFRPTSVGAVTTRTYEIENPSRIPILFEAIIPEAFQDIFNLSPSSGTLEGCQKLQLTATFSPAQGKTWDCKVVFFVSAENPSKGHDITYRQSCRVLGDGLYGVVSMEPLELNYGALMVGAEKTNTITLFNSSMCDVHYSLRSKLVRKEPFDKEHGLIPQGEPTVKFFPARQGVLRARSHQNFQVSVSISRRGGYELVVFAVVGGADLDNGSIEQPTLSDVEKLPNCRIKVRGGYPSIEITDVRSIYQCKSNLWKNLSVSGINDSLQEEVLSNDVEVKSFDFQGASEAHRPIHCDLGVDVLHSAPIKILVCIDNVGHCPVDFRFWFPDDTDIPKEPWHTNTQINEKIETLMDKAVFDISPRQATVPVGGHTVVTLTYNHTLVGNNVLPVLLRIAGGKRLLLHMSATTLEDTAKFLAFHHSMTHNLCAVAIGDMEPPLQYLELQNLGHQPIDYVVDDAALLLVREKNYDFPIFQCLNPHGTIPPVSTLLLSWYFRPLEARTYDVNVMINVVDGESYSIRLVGEGYHPKKLTHEHIRARHEKEVFSLPKFPTLFHPLLPVRLTLDVLRFGSISFHSLHRQVISLENRHAADTFLFEWHSVLQYGDQIFDIEPPRGRVAPGESVQFRVTLYSGSTSHILDNPIYCHILNESLRTRRLTLRALQQKDADMQLDGCESSANSGSRPSKSKAESKLSTVGRSNTKRASITTVPLKYQNTNRLRQTLQELSDAAAFRDLPEDDPEMIEVDVQPTILEVLIQARIMPAESFASLYGNAMARKTFCPTLLTYKCPTPVAPISAADTNEEEGLLVNEIIDEILKKVVHHPAIEETFVDPSRDPVPFFRDIAFSFSDSCSKSVESDPSEVHGSLQCVAEEVIESSLYDIISEAFAPGGIFLSPSSSQTPNAKNNESTSGTGNVTPNPTAKPAATSKSKPRAGPKPTLMATK